MFYLVILLLVTTICPLAGKPTFSDYCGKNIVLKDILQLNLFPEAADHRYMPYDVCRITVRARPVTNDTLIAIVIEVLYAIDATPYTFGAEMCDIINITHNGTTYDLCHKGRLPSMDEFVLEVHDEAGLVTTNLIYIVMHMAVFYKAQCLDIDTEICENQDEESCSMRQAMILCTEEMLARCPHMCHLCNKSAELCCYNGQYTRHNESQDALSMVRLCDSYPFGCQTHSTCHYDDCVVGKDEGPYCIMDQALIVMEGGNEYNYGDTYEQGDSDTNGDTDDADDGDGDGGAKSHGGNLVYCTYTVFAIVIAFNI